MMRVINNRRLALLLLSIGRLVDALTNGLMITLLPYTLTPLSFLGNRDFQIGLAFSIGSIVSTFAQPIIGRHADRVGRVKPWVVGGIALTGISMLLFLTRSDTISYTLFRAIQGLGIGLSVPTALALVAILAHSRKVGSTVGGYITFRMVGFLIGPPIGAWFYESGHPARGFIFGFAISMAAALLIGWMVPDARSVSRNPSVPTPQTRSKIPTIVYVLAAAQFVIGASVSMFAPLAVRLKHELGVGPMAFSYAFSAFLVVRLACQMPAGWLTDRIGPRRMVLFGVGSTALALLGFPLATNSLTLALGRAVQGLTTSFITTPGLTWGIRVAPEERLNEVMSYMTTGFGLGLAVGPVTAGVLSGIGSWGMPFTMMGFVTLLLIPFLFIRSS